MKCKKCLVKMEKIYSFYGMESEEKLSCPVCKAETEGKPIEYNKYGFIPKRVMKEEKMINKEEAA